MKIKSTFHSPWYPVTICLIVTLCLYCAGDQRAHTEEEEKTAGPLRTVYVASNGFHTGLIIDLDEITRQMLVFSKYFAPYKFADIGWGDEVFYQDPQVNLCSGLRAIMIPSSSVIRVEGFNADTGNVAAFSDRAVKFTLTNKQYIQLCTYINDSFTRDKTGGLIIDSWRGSGEIIFFKSNRTYCLFNTCNTWIARVLAHAGLDVSPVSVITASSLFDRLEKVGEKIR